MLCAGMLRCIITLYNLSQKAIADSPANQKVTWAYLRTTLGPVMQKVCMYAWVYGCMDVITLCM